MRYFLLRQQRERGCDYTIGCGMTFHPLKATTYRDAVEEVVGLSYDWKEVITKKAKEKRYTIDEYIHDYVLSGTALGDVDGDNENPMSEMKLFEVNDQTDLMPTLQARLADIKMWQKELHANDQEANERAQYEKLRKKFGK